LLRNINQNAKLPQSALIEKYAILNEVCDAYSIIKLVAPEPIEVV
jgi:hypothetical protein